MHSSTVSHDDGPNIKCDMMCPLWSACLLQVSNTRCGVSSTNAAGDTCAKSINEDDEGHNDDGDDDVDDGNEDE
jgi:hypothetical protein